VAAHDVVPRLQRSAQAPLLKIKALALTSRWLAVAHRATCASADHRSRFCVFQWKLGQVKPSPCKPPVQQHRLRRRCLDDNGRYLTFAERTCQVTWTPLLWMQPLEPVPGVKVHHRIHLKIWRIETEAGAVVIELNWHTGEMVASIEQ
jgi:hypothetical protein